MAFRKSPMVRLNDNNNNADNADNADNDAERGNDYDNNLSHCTISIG